MRTSLIVQARQRTGTSRRELARRAGTSPATVAAYEAGRVSPGVDTFDRLVAAAGCDAAVTLTRRYSGAERGHELQQVLDLAEHFPARHAEGIAIAAFPGSR